ncbi:hypothetical protein HUJ04_010872 [Dendroctonus ponderosae]|nr:hypothetical protein HUJ04_010872 [Dendroctonus ponderosae]
MIGWTEEVEDENDDDQLAKRKKRSKMVSVPLKTYKIWAFMGMMGQLPLSHVSRFVCKRYGPRFGNIVVWSSIIIGQPLCIMMYYHDYMVIHHGSTIAEYKYSFNMLMILA